MGGLAYLLSIRFVFWFAVGAGVTWWLLDRKGREPLFGALLCGLLGGFGGIFILIWIWLWMYYIMPGGMGRVYRPRNSKRWTIRW